MLGIQLWSTQKGIEEDADYYGTIEMWLAFGLVRADIKEELGLARKVRESPSILQSGAARNQESFQGSHKNLLSQEFVDRPCWYPQFSLRAQPRCLRRGLA